MLTQRTAYVFGGFTSMDGDRVSWTQALCLLASWTHSSSLDRFRGDLAHFFFETLPLLLDC